MKKPGGCDKEIQVQFENKATRLRADFSFLYLFGKTRIDGGLIRVTNARSVGGVSNAATLTAQRRGRFASGVLPESVVSVARSGMKTSNPSFGVVRW